MFLGLSRSVFDLERRRSLQILGDQTEASLRKVVVLTATAVLTMMLATLAALLHS